eukprot:13955681-Ditylum_brightwellii.AAC.1
MSLFIFCIIKRSLSQTADAGGLLVGIVEGPLLDYVESLIFEAETQVCSSSNEGDVEMLLLVIISPVVIEFERCDATGVVHSNAL